MTSELVCYTTAPFGATSFDWGGGRLGAASVAKREHALISSGRYNSSSFPDHSPRVALVCERAPCYFLLSGGGGTSLFFFTAGQYGTKTVTSYTAVVPQERLDRDVAV